MLCRLFKHICNILLRHISNRSQITQPDPDPCDATSIRDVESKETQEAGRFITILPQVSVIIY